MAEDPITAMARQWRSAGVGAGDMLLLHSSLRRVARTVIRAGGAADQVADLVLDSVLEALGPRGTLLLPLFNFDFTSGAGFDIRATPSQMGALTEAARRHPRAVRTGHPIYSFAAIGAEAPRFAGVENFSGYGPDSPFALLHAVGGRIAVLDLPDQQAMTFYHYVEEALSAPWRYHKRFEGDYVGWDGQISRRAFGLYVRDLERGVLTHVDPMGERLWAAGLYAGERPGQGRGLRTIAASALFDAVSAVINAGQAEGLLYRIEAPRSA